MAEVTPIELAWTQISEIGERATNQDAVGEASRGQLSCFVLADGAGGHAGGEVASGVVVGAVIDSFQNAPAFSDAALLSYAQCAITALAKRKQDEPRYADMSTTVVALLIDCANSQALWVHLGDSRLYLFRNARLHAMSKDHSLTQQLIDAGYAKAEHLRTHPQRNILFAAIGAEGDTDLELSAGATRLEPGDTLLLCSDGLWEWVLESDMEQTLARACDTREWLAAMCALAQTNILATTKVRDNYSAYAIRVQQAKA